MCRMLSFVAVVIVKADLSFSDCAVTAWLYMSICLFYDNN